MIYILVYILVVAQHMPGYRNLAAFNRFQMIDTPYHTCYVPDV